MQPHPAVMEALRMTGRFDLLGAEGSAPAQWSTTRISLASSLRIVSLSLWRIQRPEYRETRESNARLLTQMQASRLAQQHGVPAGQKPLAKLWPLLKKHY